jgi:hypothetical protein
MVAVEDSTMFWKMDEEEVRVSKARPERRLRPE